MGPVAYGIAEENNIPMKECIGQGVRVANGNFAPIFNTAEFGTCTKKADVLTMPTLTNMCILGGEKMREFKIVLHSHENCMKQKGCLGKHS